jgi:hypothetical protein
MRQSSWGNRLTGMENSRPGHSWLVYQEARNRDHACSAYHQTENKTDQSNLEHLNQNYWTLIRGTSHESVAIKLCNGKETVFSLLFLQARDPIDHPWLTKNAVKNYDPLIIITRRRSIAQAEKAIEMREPNDQWSYILWNSCERFHERDPGLYTGIYILYKLAFAA